MDVSQNRPNLKALTRRRMLRYMIVAGASAAAPASLLLNSHDLEITSHTVRMAHLSERLDGLRVVQITDLHRGLLVSEQTLSDAAQTVMSLEPHLVLITGDLVSLDPGNIVSCAAALSCIEAPLGIYAVLGNHDNWSGRERILHHMNSVGAPILVNESVEVETGLWVAGIDDWTSGKPDIASALAGIPGRAAAILMSHNPKAIDHLGRDLLVLAGHTHGGQINLGPLTGLLTWHVTSHGRFIRGWYKNNGTRMYVNRGVGVAGLPVRFNCPPEVALFTLRPA